MATKVLPQAWLLCPCCGRSMLAIEVAVATPPFVVELVGCEVCGITTNELTVVEPAASAAVKPGYGGT